MVDIARESSCTVCMVNVEDGPNGQQHHAVESNAQPSSLQPAYFDDMIRDSRGEINQCTAEILTTTLDKYWKLVTETEKYAIIEWMIDTGCSTVVAHSTFNRWLQNRKKSNMVMNGFSTASSEQADMAGDFCSYVLNITSSSPDAILRDPGSPKVVKGVPIDIKGVNTADIARHNLMGLGYLTSVCGFRPNEGFTGLHKNDEVTGELIDIPFFHSPKTSSWHMTTVVAHSLADAQAAGEAIELVHPHLTSATMRTALAFDRHATKIMQVCGGLMHMHFNEEQHMINIDYINLVTGFDRMQANTYLSNEAFGKWVGSMMNSSSRIGDSCTFAELASSIPVSPSDYVYDPFTSSGNPVRPIEIAEMDGQVVDYAPDDDDSVVGGLKKFTKNGDRTSSLKFHMIKGHAAYHPDCVVCRYLRLHFNRSYKHIERYLDPRPCYVFNMDILTVSHRSQRGNKYAVIMLCPAVGFFEVLFLNHKNEFIEQWLRLVDKRRNDPRFRYAAYKYMMNIHTDCDPVWDNKNRAAVAAREKLGIGFVLASPEDSNKNARGERMIQIAERAMKALMIEFRIAIQYWDYAMRSALDAKNLFPISKNMKSKDGDAPCPWNEATNHIVSRGMTIKALEHYVPCGAFAALGNSKLLASNVETPIRQSFAICLGIVDPCESDLAFWVDLHTGAIVRTNDFNIMELPIGISPYHYFGLALPPLSNRALPIPDDHRPQIKAVIQLQGIGLADSGGMTHEQKTLRDLGHLPQERAITIDQDHDVVIKRRDGEWVKTGAKLSARSPDVLQDSLMVPELEQQDRMRNASERIMANPTQMIGTSVYRRFNKQGSGYAAGDTDISPDDPVAHGVVGQFWKENGVYCWHVLYDDGYSEDFNITEMIAFGINKESGSAITSPVDKLVDVHDAADPNPNPWTQVKRKHSKQQVASPAPLQLADRSGLPTDITGDASPNDDSCFCGCSS